MEDEDEDIQRAEEGKRRFTTSKHHFHRIFKRFACGVKKNEDEAVLKQILRDLEESYKNMELKYALYVQVLDTNRDEVKQVVREAELLMAELYDELCTGRLLMRKTELNGNRDKAMATTQSGSCSKMGNCKEYANDNDYKEYPKKYRELAEISSFILNDTAKFPSSEKSKSQDFHCDQRKDEDHPLYMTDPNALKRYLSGEALDDLQHPTPKLEGRKSEQIEMIDDILHKLKTLKPCGADDWRRFIETVDVVESCWMEMRRMNLTEELNNEATVNHIEKILPPSTLRAWALIKYGKGLYLPKMDKFTHLLEFLVKEKASAKLEMRKARKMKQRIRNEVSDKERGDLLDDDSDYDACDAAAKDSDDSDDDMNVINSRSDLTMRRPLRNNPRLVQHVMGGVAQIVEAITSTSSGNRRMLSRLPQSHDGVNKHCRCCLSKSAEALEVLQHSFETFSDFEEE